MVSLPCNPLFQEVRWYFPGAFPPAAGRKVVWPKGTFLGGEGIVPTDGKMVDPDCINTQVLWYIPTPTHAEVVHPTSPGQRTDWYGPEPPGAQPQTPALYAPLS